MIMLCFHPRLPAVTVFGQELPSGPHGCTEGSCYPATGNLLIGRAVNLSATSTCGLNGPEQYCIVSHLQESDKCFECNSRHRYDPYHHKNSHRIENVIYLMDRNEDNTWWQSVNGVCAFVPIRLNLEAEFHFTHLIMKFKTFRPAAMIIERSADFGRTWRPYRYFASNCTKTFPGIPANGLHHINDIICDERYSDIEPSTHGEVIYKVLDPAIHVKDPYSLDIQELLRITNLRINFTKLNTLGDDLLDRRFDVLQKYYYAIYELVVRGSCFCYGHASECAPVPGVDIRENGMIHGRCVCKHNTEGLNCERCRDFHNDLPWRPAEAENPHTCRECNCNGHSSQCHFDMAVYFATANISGGVCDDCLHNTMGRNCEMCKPFYYQDPIRDTRDPRVCVACDCDPVGSLEGGVCDSHTDPDMGMIAGQCRCKANVKGTRCDDCKEGYYGLSQNDPLGCQPCNCDPRGIIMIGTPCDQISGDCSCKRYVTGRYCNQCLPEYWGLSNDLAGCRPCDCDFGGAFNNRCMMENGQCDCRRHLIGRQCSEVQPGYFCAPLDYYKYEAEDPDVRTVHREHTPSHMVSWTGPGFARVKDGAGLVFTIDNIPYAMEYDIMIRYEPEVSFLYVLCFSRYIQMPRPFCFEPSNRYVVAIRFQRHGVLHRHLTAFILIDSVMISLILVYVLFLIPVRTNRIRLNNPLNTSSHPACDCHSEGSVSHQCDPVTGQCQCRQGSTGRQCSDCQLGQWGFPNCSPCQCNGHADICDPRTGECRDCRDYTAGHYCDHCVDGFFGNPVLGLGEHCRPCPCPGNPDSDHFNGHSCQADLSSNQIICNCREGYTGPRCDRCAPGYYGNPEQPGGQCLPCECSGNINAQDPESCDPRTGQCLKCLYYTDGPSCAHCQHGYYGNALAHDCRRCTCVTAGTLQSACSDGQCHCDRQTGACPCRENVAGHNCDQCAPNHWNYGQDRGCEPCHCDPQHTMGTHCNMFTGQCHCHSGFGGRQCTECEQFHWGDPQVQCQECNCHPLGSEMVQCDRETGACECREGAAGKRCDECARGFTGVFPKCVQCHPCFQLWDDAVCQIKRDLDHIQYTVQKILESGVPTGDGDTRIKELEKKLKQVQDLISVGLDHLSLYSLKYAALCVPGLRSCSRCLTDQFEKVKKNYRLSLEAEEKCNLTVSGPLSPVGQSKETRNRTEVLLNDSRDKFLLITHCCSLQVCGGHSNASSNGSCPNSQCGGAGCRDDQGSRVCGGEGCNGTVSSSLAALNHAKNVTDSLKAANEELHSVARKLQDIASLTQDVIQVQSVYHFCVPLLRPFCCPEEGADPESIEKVALQVLSITLPINRTTLDKMIMQIKDSFSNLTNIEGIVNQTSQHISKAKELLLKPSLLCLLLTEMSIRNATKFGLLYQPLGFSYQPRSMIVEDTIVQGSVMI
uniref:Laminin, beta 2-like n=1 Tax=Dicentrarchus labrax TaxID=13489 RepID=A0A8C4HDS2_DICLA